MKTSSLPVLLAATLVAASLGVGAATAPSKVQPAVQAQAAADKANAASQKKIDKTVGGTDDMLNQYLQVTQQTDDLRAYDDQLQQINQAETDQMNSLSQQTSQVDVVKKGLLPLLLQMLDSLNQYVNLDIPYHKDERLARLQSLRTLLSNPSVAITDKFQKLVQAYDDEIAAGKSVESYRGQISEGSKTLTVNFLRVGHLALAYQTLDGGETGYWDKQKHQWQVDDDYRDAVAQAIAVANKQAAPDLLEVPVEAPGVAK
jgi:hypothetical protein